MLIERLNKMLYRCNMLFDTSKNSKSELVSLNIFLHMTNECTTLLTYNKSHSKLTFLQQKL